MEGMIGEIRMFAGTFAPKTWAFCAGQILNIASNTALFSILGTTYGGNGTTTFALPDLRGRTAVGAGTGLGLSPIELGQQGGTESATMAINNMPMHTHVGAGTFTGKFSPQSSGDGGSANPVSNYQATNEIAMFSTAGSDGSQMGGSPFTGTLTGTTISPTGGNQPFSILNPYIAVYYVICQYGIFPSRN